MLAAAAVLLVLVALIGWLVWEVVTAPTYEDDDQRSGPDNDNQVSRIVKRSGHSRRPLATSSRHHPR